MRATIVVLGLALPFCPGCFTIMGAAIAAAGGGPGAVETGAQIDADIARGVAESMTSGGHQTSAVSSVEPGLSAYSTADAYLCTVPGADAETADTQVIEARSLTSAVEVCAAFNDLEGGGSCVCHAIREPAPRDG